jgi:hypothetical protein
MSPAANGPSSWPLLLIGVVVAIIGPFITSRAMRSQGRQQQADRTREAMAALLRNVAEIAAALAGNVHSAGNRSRQLTLHRVAHETFHTNDARLLRSREGTMKVLFEQWDLLVPQGHLAMVRQVEAVCAQIERLQALRRDQAERFLSGTVTDRRAPVVAVIEAETACHGALTDLLVSLERAATPPKPRWQRIKDVVVSLWSRVTFIPRRGASAPGSG